MRSDQHLERNPAVATRALQERPRGGGRAPAGPRSSVLDPRGLPPAPIRALGPPSSISILPRSSIRSRQEAVERVERETRDRQAALEDLAAGTRAAASEVRAELQAQERAAAEAQGRQAGELRALRGEAQELQRQLSEGLAGLGESLRQQRGEAEAALKEGLDAAARAGRELADVGQAAASALAERCLADLSSLGAELRGALEQQRQGLLGEVVRCREGLAGELQAEAQRRQQERDSTAASHAEEIAALRAEC
ncbi:unnamed protein product, partial [Prorocentrum cordatum]